MSILEATVSSQRRRVDSFQKTLSDQHHRSVTTTAAAILLKEHHPKMSALHYIISLSLHREGATRATYARLSSIGLCMTDKSVIRKMDEMCCQFDQEVKEWQFSVEQYMAGLSPVLADDFQIIGDNLDLEITPHLSKVHQKKQSVHWFNLLVVKHRVQGQELPDDQAQKPIQQLQNYEFLPSLSDHSSLRAQFVFFVSGILLKRLDCFSEFAHLVVHHIQHRNSDIMKKKSAQVWYVPVTELWSKPYKGNLFHRFLRVS